MTNEKAIVCNENLKEYMRITDKNSEHKFFAENYEALDMANKALESKPRWTPVSEGLPKERVCTSSQKRYSGLVI